MTRWQGTGFATGLRCVEKWQKLVEKHETVWAFTKSFLILATFVALGAGVVGHIEGNGHIAALSPDPPSPHHRPIPNRPTIGYRLAYHVLFF